MKNIGGESNFEVRARMEKFLDDALKKYIGKNIAIVSHGAAIRFLLLKYCRYNDVYDTFYYRGESILTGQLVSPSVLKLVFEDEELIKISKV